MNNLTELPIGTKLMWDASPNTYPTGPKQGEAIIYPAIVTDQASIGNRNKYWGAKIKTGANSSWMGNEQPYLREPSENELNTLAWPNL